MYYVAPLVLILGLSGALYKTQEVFSLDAYTVYYLRSAFGRREFLMGPGLKTSGVKDRAAYLAALKAQSEASAAKRSAASASSGSGV